MPRHPLNQRPIVVDDLGSLAVSADVSCEDHLLQPDRAK